MNDIDKIKAKIKKLLALSKSPNPNEAATALRMAQELMAEYKVGQADVNTLDIGDETARTVRRKTPPLYEGELVQKIAMAFGCRIIYHRRQNSCVWRFVGLRHRAQVSAYIGQVLLRKLKSARAEYIRTLYRVRSKYRKTQRADDFCSAWVSAVTDKLSAFAGLSKEEQQAITAYCNKAHPELKDLNSTSRSFGNPADYHNGRRAGEGVELQHGVGVDPRRPLFLGA
ncbi:MAG: DUF2786 domain-containing protein [Treponema sp.]|nr:DUF2786 domain-containing protein [Treponema sp.]MCL2233722.1 DUF2786 domain-containing protein [Treponema sp.]